MHTTKGQILSLLKRHGRATVDGLAEDLGLAAMTVRQHLASLERDGLVQAAVERQRKGRPHFIYSLTDKGQKSFPQHYDRLVANLLDELARVDAREIEALGPSQRISYILSRLADRLVAQHAWRLRDFPLDEKVREIAALLAGESGFVEWSKAPYGYEVRDYNCIYRGLEPDNSERCSWHSRVLEQLTGRPVLCVAPAQPDEGYCRSLILVESAIGLPLHWQDQSVTPRDPSFISQEVH